MIITKKGGRISFSFPEKSKRLNPYDEDGDYGEYPTFTGLIVHNRKSGNNFDEVGFAQTIDMDYKGKPDQVGGILVGWFGDVKDFKKECKKLGIGWQEMTIE